MSDSRPSGHPCVLPGDDGRPCGRPSGGTPFALCPAHVELVVEWAGTEWGTTDLLPVPCRACGSRLGVRYPSGWACAACEWRVGDVLDDGLPPPRVDVVYYIRFQDRVKIETTANPRRRLARIWHDEVLAFERGDRLVEHRRHEQFAAWRLDRSEWFKLAPEVEDHIGRLAAGVDDPWARYARWLGEAAALHG
ncbi:GIY-YIG nuclease family protein [Arthrobacter burdickii]|uniref:GIY-YIG nuclease family protein n=1 Tax=Arthrobacter burdickii TaxID=3035920 RepID=A0ABT8K062_9MICC|nr:GIY-YIG nuclease family protein [Arthrobacter burdickii]MDN4610811.1 GIY-YIG nuclease family protein [Arthrobacter burdickii]